MRCSNEKNIYYNTASIHKYQFNDIQRTAIEQFKKINPSATYVDSYFTHDINSANFMIAILYMIL